MPACGGNSTKQSTQQRQSLANFILQKRKSNESNTSLLAIHSIIVQLFENIKLCALAFVRGAENAIVGGGFYLEKMGGARVMTP